MMKPSENRQRGEITELLNGPMARRILTQGEMCSESVVVAGVGGKDPTQMAFAEDDDVIKAFRADRADQSLRMSILPE